ncbi:MAG: magnesium transporter [Phycisphaerae bacterium]|nr:magnesium transporter [Phycisphaerae bacterium]
MTDQDIQSKVEEPREPDITHPEALAEEHPADVADALEALPPGAGADVLEAMPPEAAADALEEMDEADAEEIIEDMEPEAAATALSLMALDDAADLLAELPPENRAQILRTFPDAQRAELEDLMTYPQESAGGIMSPEVVALPANLTVADAITDLRTIAHESEQIYYTYVVDHQHRLVGVLSLRDLILAPETKCLHEIMINKIVSVPVTMDREKVASMLSKYGYYALPVVAEDNRLLGIVTIDDVVEIIEEEATEDMQVMVGAGADERVDSPLTITLRRRLPWLMVNLGTAFVAASVVSMFESQLAKLTVLAVLMPVVAGQAGNSGAQTMAVVIRGIATGETRGLALLTLLSRNLIIGIASGAATGSVAGLAAWLWWRDIRLALVLGGAILLCMMIATVSGAFVPWAMRRLGFDPAQSSSIILTTITDVAGFGIFLALGAWLVVSQLDDT